MMTSAPSRMPEAEPGHDELPEQRLGVGDEEDEPEVQHHHRDGQRDGDAPAGVVQGLELFGVIHRVRSTEVDSRTADLKVGTTLPGIRPLVRSAGLQPGRRSICYGMTAAKEAAGGMTGATPDLRSCFGGGGSGGSGTGCVSSSRRSSHSFTAMPAMMSANPASEAELRRSAAAGFRDALRRRPASDAGVSAPRLFDQVVRILFGEVESAGASGGAMTRTGAGIGGGATTGAGAGAATTGTLTAAAGAGVGGAGVVIPQLDERRGHDVRRDDPGPFEMPRDADDLSAMRLRTRGFPFDERNRRSIASGTNVRRDRRRRRR